MYCINLILFCTALLTVWWELVFLKHSDAQDILVQVLDKELTVEVPLRVQSVVDRSGGVALSPHGQLAVWITLSCKKRKNERV